MLIGVTRGSLDEIQHGFAQKVFHCIRTASGSDRPNNQLLEGNLITEINGCLSDNSQIESLAGRYRFRF